MTNQSILKTNCDFKFVIFGVSYPAIQTPAYVFLNSCLVFATITSCMGKFPGI